MKWSGEEQNSARTAREITYYWAVNISTTDVRQRFEKVQSAIRKGETVTVTEHGRPTMRISPVSKRDKQAAADALRALGPIPILPRK